MLKNMKIGTRIVLATFILVAFAVLSTSVITGKNFYDSLIQDAKDKAALSVHSFEFMLREEMERTALMRDHLADNPTIAYALRAKSASDIYAETERFVNVSGLDVVTFIAADGTVVARAHDMGNVGDNASNAPDFREAMAGGKYEWLMEGMSLRFGYYCGAPIRIGNEIVGMVRVAKSLVTPSVVDRIKEMFGVETTIFAGKTRVNTTLSSGGERMIGSDALPEIARAVLEMGGEFSDQVELFGKKYIAHYAPLRDGSGGVKGMIFVGNSLEKVNPLIWRAMFDVALSALATITIAFGIAYMIGRMISRPLVGIVNVVKRGGGGDLTISRSDFGYDGGGELEMLVDSIYDMIRAQVESIEQVVITSGTVRENAQKLSSISEENDGAMTHTLEVIGLATEQCEANVESVGRGSSAVETMMEGIATVAEMASDSARALARVTERSRGAASSVERLADGMGEIGAKTEESQSKISELVASIAEISNFTGAIQAIAEQTNLLALNAAIEAARAGEAGRGFAVVAEEVRKLADESRSASRSIEGLVSILRRNAEEAIAVSERSVRVVREIGEMAVGALGDMNGAMKEISSANESTQSIASIAQEQAASTAEMSSVVKTVTDSTVSILRKMKELQDLSDRTAAVGHSVSDTAVEMSRSVEDLKSVLAQFRID
jgi:methyl-accepting chemotaxis protein